MSIKHTEGTIIKSQQFQYIIKNLFLINRYVYFLEKYNHCNISNIGRVETTQIPDNSMLNITYVCPRTEDYLVNDSDALKIILYWWQYLHYKVNFKIQNVNGDI